MRKFLITIIDIGPYRLFRRIIYEIQCFFDENCPPKLLKYIYKLDLKDTKFIGKELDSKLKNINQENEFKSIKFKFLNNSRCFSSQINWDSRDIERLWNFNLHYFDWVRRNLDIALKGEESFQDLKFIKVLIYQWISRNKYGKKDGWHSYTTSLRIRNWILILRIFPDLNETQIIKSLYQQIIWLYKHPEDYLGGNHWLDNLITLCIGALNFDNKIFEEIFRESINRLEKELDSQILADGGHEERSASYHILILDHLIELGCAIYEFKGNVPSWLYKKINLMKDWILSIRLYDGSFPRFNDSPNDICDDLDEVLNFANDFLNKKFSFSKGIRGLLIKSVFGSKISNYKLKDIKNEKLTILLNTGWDILRLGNGWELIFKSGKSCPPHLPPHAHSDLLSFDLYYRGLPIFFEAGTSTYRNNAIRKFERSGAAHNCFQVAEFTSDQNKDLINWLESVEVWNSFRAGRKGKIIYRNSGLYDDGTIWIEASHDAFDKLKLNYKRRIEINVLRNDFLKLKIIEKLNCNRPINWRQNWHFSPFLNDDFIDNIYYQLTLNNEFKQKFSKTSCSLELGKLLERKTLYIIGICKKGSHYLSQELILNPSKLL